MRWRRIWSSWVGRGATVLVEVDRSYLPDTKAARFSIGRKT